MQIAVDTQHHLIVAHDVSNVGSDRHQLANMAGLARSPNLKLGLPRVISRGGPSAMTTPASRTARLCCREESPATNTRLAAKYPLNVISPKSHAFLNSCYGNLPAQLHHAGEQVVLVNPRDAIAQNIGEGSPVRIFNDRGSFEALRR